MVDCGVSQRWRLQAGPGIYLLLASVLFVAQSAPAAMPSWCAGESATLLSRILRQSASSKNVSAKELMASGLEAFQRGDAESAATDWLGAVAGYKAQGDAKGRAAALYRLSRAYYALGLRPEERAALEQAMPLARGTMDAELIASVLSALAWQQQAEGHPERASALIAEALEAARKAESPVLEAVTLNVEGGLHSARKQHSEAARAYAESSALATRGGDAVLALKAAANRARAEIDGGGAETVAKELGDLLEQARALPDSSAKAELMIHLGRSYGRLQGDSSDQRQSLLADAATAFQEASLVAERAGATRAESYALGYLGHLYELEGRRSEALGLSRRALAAAGEAGAAEAQYRWHWQMGRLWRDAGELAEAIEAYRRAARTLRGIRSESIGQGSESFETAVGPVFLGLVDLLLQRASTSGDVKVQRDSLLAARASLEQLKSAELRDYFHDECLAAATTTAPDRIPRTAVVYPVLLEDRTELIVSLPDGLTSVRVAVGRERITSEIRSFRRYIQKRTTRQYLAPAATLYDWLVRPWEELMAGQSIETVVFVPGGALRTIPMAALWDRDSRKFLIEKFPLAVVPSLTLTSPRAIDREHTQALLAGLSESVQGYPALKNVPFEAEALMKVFEGRSLMNEEFIAPAFEAALLEKPFGIVHVASHGEFRAEADESYLLTYDDRITMNELAGLVGATRYREEPLELLVLSACETAVGDDRAALGLAGVAVRAGARSAMATLWRVNDRAAGELVAEFYRQLVKPATSRAQALQRAQIKSLKTRRYRHPGYWAPFLMISNWM